MHVPGKNNSLSGGYSAAIKPSYDKKPASPLTAAQTKSAIASYGQLLHTPMNSAISYVNEVATELAIPPLLAGEYWVICKDDKLSLLPIKKVQLAVRKQQIEIKLANGLVSQPLLMPVSVAADLDWPETLAKRDQLLRKMGIELTIRFQQLIIKKVPPYLRESQLAVVIPELLQWIQIEQPSDNAIVGWLAQQSLSQFEPVQVLWQQFCALDDETKQTCYDQEHVLPWQNWMKNN